MPSDQQNLLLLSPSPSYLTYANVKAAYYASLLAVLKELQHQADSKVYDRRTLDIALPCYDLYVLQNLPRTVAYDKTQTLLALLYKLITVISTTHSIDVEPSSGLDVRVLLLKSPSDIGSSQDETENSSDELTGPVISVQTLAASQRPWETIYSVQTEQGERVLKAFLGSTKAYANIQRVRGGITAVSNGSPIVEVGKARSQRHFSVAVGGTFDHLHIGHKLLLTMFAFMLDRPQSDTIDVEKRTLTIGVTAGELLKNKKYAEQLESWETRQKSVWDYLSATMVFTPTASSSVKVHTVNEEGPNGHAVHYHLPSGVVIKLVEIWDPFGPTINDQGISALVISAETRSGGKAVNDKRKEKGWPELDVFEVDVLDADEVETGQREVTEGFQNKLSSTEIRRLQSERSKRGSKV